MKASDEQRSRRILKGAGWFAGNFFFAGSAMDARWAAKNGLLDRDGVTEVGLAYWTAGKTNFPPRRSIGKAA